MRFNIAMWLLLFVSIHANAIDPSSLKPAIKQLYALSESPILVKVIQEHHKPLTIRHMLKIDQQWRLNPSIAEKLLVPEAQRVFEDFMKQKQNLFIELILMGSYGETLGAIPITSDYWQGDEPKFMQVMGHDEIFIDALNWDESTQTISAQISVPIVSGTQIIGVLTGAVEANLKALGNAEISEQPQ